MGRPRFRPGDRARPSTRTEGTAGSVTESSSRPAIAGLATSIGVMTSVCAAFGLGEKDRDKRGNRWYWRGKLSLPSGGVYEIVVAQQLDMGQVDAATLVADVLRYWNPTAALLVGIAASADPSKVKPGDVVVGKSVWHYEHRRLAPEGGKPQPERAACRRHGSRAAAAQRKALSRGLRRGPEAQVREPPTVNLQAP